MSKPKPGRIEDIAAMTVLGRDPPAPDMSIPDLIARFQLETEAALKAQRAETVKLVEGLERRVAELTDAWTVTREGVKALEKRIESAIHDMQQAVGECINAQRQSVAAAAAAKQSAEVFEKLRASQPDLHRMVRDQDKVVASVRDQFAHLEEKVGGLSRKLDEFELVAEDYEETKGTVRSMDIAVKDLNTEARQRRQVGGRGS